MAGASLNIVRILGSSTLRTPSARLVRLLLTNEMSVTMTDCCSDPHTQPLRKVAVQLSVMPLSSVAPSAAHSR